MGKTTPAYLTSAATDALSAQRLRNSEVHDWFRFVWGYSDHLVSGLLDEFGVAPGMRVLDPFCGTGTTLVECLKRGIDSDGIDASPASCFVSRAKSDWTVRPKKLRLILDDVLECYQSLPAALQDYEDDITFAYLSASGMRARGWISDDPLRDVLALKHAVLTVDAPRKYRSVLTLALIDTVVSDASNVRFGPELYVTTRDSESDLIDAFASRVLKIAYDLESVSPARALAKVHLGDARRAGVVLRHHNRFHAVICSPPYPAEHDYTRNARLELAFLESVTDRAELRAVKRTMIRSHTKGIYADDRDHHHASWHPDVVKIADEIDHAVHGQTHGFARLYSMVVLSYFGGMFRHLRSLRRSLLPGARLAYVVGDQASYANIPIPTGRILGDFAEAAGYRVDGLRKWRIRQSSGTSRPITEDILFLTVPPKNRRLTTVA